MAARLHGIFRTGAVATACLAALNTAAAQSAAPNPLRDQIAGQYKPAKITFGAQGATVNDPGAVLVVQMEGIVAVPRGSAGCTTTFKDGQLLPPGSGCAAPGKERGKFQLQDRVYLSKLSVNRAADTVTMTILACETCSGAAKSSYRQGEIIFQYPKGYLASADAGQIEDVIAQVLTVSSGADDAQQSPASTSAGPGTLGNADVIKLVKAGLPAAVIVSKIKSSSCDFDTSPDALIRLKASGVNDQVLEAMVQAPSAAAAAAAQTTTAQAPSGCGDYNSCMSSGQTAASQGAWDQAISAYQQASTLNTSSRDPLDQMALAYLVLGRNEELGAVLDRILQMGQPVVMRACRERALGCESGTFSMSTGEVSFVDAQNHPAFAVPPSQVGLPEAKQHLPAQGDAPYFGVHVGGKTYNFDVLPPADSCAVTGPLLKCPPEALRQQLAMDHYVVRTLQKMSGAAGH